MILAAVDIGNTLIHVGLFRGARLISDFSVASRDADRANRRLRKADVVAVASVFPGAEKRLRHPKLRKMGRDFPPAVKIDVDRPSEVGMDRLANAAGGHARAKGACVVVDLGTAITFDVVNGRGAFVGGLIAPGLDLGAHALAKQTALLPRVRPAKPRRIVARRTRTNIQAGLYWSAAGLIESGLREVRRELGRRVPAYGTGGGARLFRKFFDRVIPTITLEGIRISHDRHCRADDSARSRSHRRR